MSALFDDESYRNEVLCKSEILKNKIIQEINSAAGVEMSLFKESLERLTVVRNNYFYAEQTGKITDKENVALKIAEAEMESASATLFRAIKTIILQIKDGIIEEQQSHHKEIQLSIFSFIHAAAEIYANRELSCFSFATLTELSTFPDWHFKTHPDDVPLAQDNINKGKKMLEKFRQKTKY